MSGFRFWQRRKRKCALLFLVMLLCTGAIQAAEEMNSITLGAELADELGIRFQRAEPGIVRRTLLQYGRVVPDPAGVTDVAARYPGIVRSIAPQIGDRVETGQILGVIEANNNLQRYEIRSPASGVVISRNASAGEITEGTVLLTILDYSLLWVELQLFPREAALVRIGQPIVIRMEDLQTESRIASITPNLGNSPTVTVRVQIPNPDLTWTPGLLVEGEITIEEQQAELVIDDTALQQLGDDTVVFVATAEGYQARPVQLGKRGDAFSEVLEGLEVGDSYVTEGSFLLKAELQKSAFEDED